jgi:hypothetical protein
MTSIRDTDRALLGWRVARAQHVSEQVLVGFVIEGEKACHRQVAPRVVVPVEEGQLLRSMRGTVRRVQIDRHMFDATRPESLPVPFDDTLGERYTHAIQLATARSILKTRQRRLGGQRQPRERVTTEQELVNRILRQARGIVAVGISARRSRRSSGVPSRRSGAQPSQLGDDPPGKLPSAASAPAVRRTPSAELRLRRS